MTPLEELRLALATIDRESKEATHGEWHVHNDGTLSRLSDDESVEYDPGLRDILSPDGTEVAVYAFPKDAELIVSSVAVYRGVVRDVIADAIDHPEVFAVFEATTITYETGYDAAALRLARSINSRTEGAGG